MTTYRDQLIEAIRTASSNWVSDEMAGTIADSVMRLNPDMATIRDREVDLECYLRQARERASLAEVELSMEKKKKAQTVSDDEIHFAVSTFLAIYNGSNGMDAMRNALAVVFPSKIKMKKAKKKKS